MEIIHFGKKIVGYPSNYINKEFYLSSKKEYRSGWKEEHYPKQLEYADFNYDLNMKFFESLNSEKFNLYLDNQIKKYKFIQCFDLKEVSQKWGVYMLVLDKYNQVYIGQAKNIRQRIVRHWGDWKTLERLIYGDLLSSIISIDSFGPLDTTRIYYIETYNNYEVEEKIISKFNDNYLINRTKGGIGSTHNYTADYEATIMTAVANRRKRDYSKFIDINKFKEIVGDGYKYYVERYPYLKEKDNETCK